MTQPTVTIPDDFNQRQFRSEIEDLRAAIQSSLDYLEELPWPKMKDAQPGRQNSWIDALADGVQTVETALAAAEESNPRNGTWVRSVRIDSLCRALGRLDKPS